MNSASASNDQRSSSMALSASEQQIQQDAIEFAKANKKAIARRLTDRTIFVPEQKPVSVFMAGSPGAGKTEAAIELLNEVANEGTRTLHIDPDALRTEFAAYTGRNSWLFQGAVSILVEKVHDLALEQKQSFLLDGTLSNFDIAKKNIDRSLGKGRQVTIYYVYQDPQQAWGFVCARERQEGRMIPKQHFIDQYFGSRNTVNRLKLHFGKAIAVDLLLKNNDGSNRSYKAGVDQIDYHVPEKYTPEDIFGLLK